jgi:hypothetical protein
MSPAIQTKGQAQDWDSSGIILTFRSKVVEVRSFLRPDQLLEDADSGILIVKTCRFRPSLRSRPLSVVGGRIYPVTPFVTTDCVDVAWHYF